MVSSLPSILGFAPASSILDKVGKLSLDECWHLKRQLCLSLQTLTQHGNKAQLRWNITLEIVAVQQEKLHAGHIADFCRNGSIEFVAVEIQQYYFV